MRTQKQMPRIGYAKVLMVVAFAAAIFSTGCVSSIKLGSLPTPPPKARLRVFVNAVTTERQPVKWNVSPESFRNQAYNRVWRILTEKDLYDVVSPADVKKILGQQTPQAFQWASDDWALAKEAAQRLHAEYALIIERGWDHGGYFNVVLINVASQKQFKKFVSIPPNSANIDWHTKYSDALETVFGQANPDLLETANRKGRVASEALAETKKEIQQFLVADRPRPDDKKQEVVDPDKKAPTAPTVNKPAPVKATANSDRQKQEKIAQLEARLAKLLETLAQVEAMKKQFEAQRVQTTQLEQTLAQKEEHEKMLLNKLRESAKAAPVIVLAEPRDGSTVEFKVMQISGVAEDDKGLKTLEIYLNGRLVQNESSRGVVVSGVGDLKRREFKERLQLSKGLNHLKIRAVDTEGQVAEKLVSVEYVERRKNMWAVVIGIDTYPNVRHLKYAVNDARLFYNLLVTRNRIPAENIILLLNQEATLQKIRGVLGTTLKNKAGKDDMVVIYFAGHGATERDNSSPDGDGLEKYLLPYDADLKDLYATALPMSELSRIFGRIQSERLVYIADACYSGAGGGRTIGAKGLRASLSDAFIDRIAGGKGRVIITASGANEVSAEKDELKHGVFTYYLVQGLQGPADADKDGLITVDEAYSYVSEHVPQATGQEQHPVKKGTVEGRLVLSVVP